MEFLIRSILRSVGITSYYACLVMITTTVTFIALSEADWSAEGRVGFRLYKDEATSFTDEPMETGLRLFESPYYNISLPSVIIIHGMDASVDCEFVEGSVKAMYFQGINKQFNIFALNIPELLAKQTIYDKFLYTTAKNSKIAGDAIGEFLNKVIQHGYISPDKIYVIGYSMGAQVAGYLARQVKNNHGLIEFILGLDPAGIGFTASTIASWFTQLVHVNAEDAKFTHFVHCNSLGWGTLSRDATANFVFNGGSFQPGCLADSNVACSHNRVPFYFIESIIYPTRFPSQRCESWKMFSSCGCTSEDIRYITFPPDLKASGIYHLWTNGHSSFGQSLDGIKCNKGTDTTENIEDPIKKREEEEEMLKENAKHRTLNDQNLRLKINGITFHGTDHTIVEKEIATWNPKNRAQIENKIKRAKHRIRKKSKDHIKTKHKFRLRKLTT